MQASRLDRLFDYPYRRLRALLDGLAPPEGVRAIEAHIGEPQGRPPALIAEIVAREADLWGRYPPPAGTPAYRRAAAGWCARRFGLGADGPDPETEVVAVCCTREALFQAALLAVARKDGMPRKPVVLLPNPFYHVYWGAALMAGAEPVCVPADPANRFLPRYQAVPEDIWARAALVYLCTPANPTGAVADLGDLGVLLARCREVDAVLAVDECYADIYRGDPPAGGLQAARAAGGGWANLLTFNSLSKRSGAPGLRAGFVAGDADLIARLTMLRGYGGAQVPGPILAAGAALWDDDAHAAQARARYARLFEIARAAFAGLPGVVLPKAAFFLWLKVDDGEAFARRAWAECGVKVMPGRYMARPDETGRSPGDSYARVALVHDEDTARALCARLARLMAA